MTSPSYERKLCLLFFLSGVILKSTQRGSCLTKTRWPKLSIKLLQTFQQPQSLMNLWIRVFMSGARCCAWFPPRSRKCSFLICQISVRKEAFVLQNLQSWAKPFLFIFILNCLFLEMKTTSWLLLLLLLHVSWCCWLVGATLSKTDAKKSHKAESEVSPNFWSLPGNGCEVCLLSGHAGSSSDCL